MNRIIMPASTTAHALSPLSVLGHLRVGDLSLNLNHISEVESRPGGEVFVVMTSGNAHTFQGDTAKQFLTQLTEIATAVMQQVSQPRIQSLPPGTHIR